jgi:hypothetical protein
MKCRQAENMREAGVTFKPIISKKSKGLQRRMVDLFEWKEKMKERQNSAELEKDQSEEE